MQYLYSHGNRSNSTLSVPSLDSSPLVPPSETVQPQKPKKNAKGHRELSNLDESRIITSSGRPKRQRIERKYSK